MIFLIRHFASINSTINQLSVIFLNYTHRDGRLGWGFENFAFAIATHLTSFLHFIQPAARGMGLSLWFSQLISDRAIFPRYFSLSLKSLILLLSHNFSPSLSFSLSIFDLDSFCLVALFSFIRIQRTRKTYLRVVLSRNYEKLRRIKSLRLSSSSLCCKIFIINLRFSKLCFCFDTFFNLIICFRKSLTKIPNLENCSFCSSSFKSFNSISGFAKILQSVISKFYLYLPIFELRHLSKPPPAKTRQEITGKHLFIVFTFCSLSFELALQACRG